MPLPRGELPGKTVHFGAACVLGAVPKEGRSSSRVELAEEQRTPGTKIRENHAEYWIGSGATPKKLIEVGRTGSQVITLRRFGECFARMLAAVDGAGNRKAAKCFDEGARSGRELRARREKL